MKVKLDEGAYTPVRAHSTDAGLDIKSPIKTLVPARGAVTIRTGVHINLPKNTAGILISKSGLNVKHGITSTGLIDESYTGEIVVKLFNHSPEPYLVNAGDKVTQLIITPVLYESVEIVDELDEGERGDKGFGSSGK